MSQRQNIQTNDKGKASADKNRKTQKMEKYRNKITDLLKESKLAHYQKHFGENKKNCRALWIGINKIVYSKNKTKTNSLSSLIQDGKTTTDQKHITEHVNNFFTSTGKNYKTSSRQLKSIF